MRARALLLLFLAAVVIVPVAEELLGDGHRGWHGDADRRAGDDLLAGRHAFLFVFVGHLRTSVRRVTNPRGPR